MDDTNLRISIIGLGKLGSPMAAVYASKGYHVIGLDVNKEFVDALQRGEAPVNEPQLQELINQYKTNIETTMDYYKAVSETNMTMIIVPTPSDPNTGFFSNDYVLSAIKSIGEVIKSCHKYHQIVVVSTVMPGSMGGIICDVLESSSGRKVGCLDSEIGLAYNPEFIALGQVIRDMLNPDFILIGESDKLIGDALEVLHLKTITKRPLPFHRMNFINAEITKISINTYVTTKITYANMLSELCENLSGADVDIVSTAVGCDSRIGNKYLKGALAYGGPCFPRDNRAFVALAKSVSANPLLAEATEQLNNYQVKRLIRICNKIAELRFDNVSHIRPKVGILGLSYKPDTSVVECSAACILANKLIGNFDIFAYDPLAMPLVSQICDRRMQLVSSIDKLLYENNIDILLITTASNSWKNITFKHTDKKTLYVVDCWRLLNKEEIEKTYQHIHIILLGNGDSKMKLQQLKTLDKECTIKLIEQSLNASNSRLRILVAGGAGFIGSHLGRRLLKEGHYIICADWKKNEYFQEEEFCNEFLHIDLRVLDNCLMATKQCDWVFNLAADMGGMGYIQSNNSVILFNNTLISFNMIEAARRNGVRRFFYASSACVYPENIQTEENIAALKEEQAWPAKPQDAYGLEKLVSEELVMHYAKDFQKMQTRIARFHNIYGPQGQWKGGREKAPAAFCRKVLVAHEGENHGVVTVWGNGKQTRSFCYIEDCIDGIMRLMQSDYTQPLNIGSDEMASMNDMIGLICEIEQVAVTLKHIPGPEGVRGRNSDNSLIKEVLKWAPTTTLSQGLKSTYKFIKSQLENEKTNGIDISTYALSKVVVQTTETLEAIGQVKHNKNIYI
jgi:GDP-D-mannose 3',5'-epimerase